MILNLVEIARHFGVRPLLIALAAAGVLTGAVSLTQSIAGCFDGRDS